MRPSPRSRAAAGSLLAVPIALLALAPSACAQVYYTGFLAEGGTGIERSTFDGSGRQSLAFQPIGFADALALDMAAGKMYWTETSAGAIWRANLNGSEPQTVVIDSGREPLGIALDLAHEQMYWTDSEGVKRAKLDGTDSELLTKEQARGFIALDRSTQQMFWADWASGTIRSAPMTGTTVVTSIVKGQPCPFGIALDETDGEVYWLGLEVKERLKCAKGSSIIRAKIDGSGSETIVKRPVGTGFEGGLALEPAAGRLYWTEAEAHDVRSANLDGTGERTLFSTGGDFPIGLAIEAADPHPLNVTAPALEGNAVVGSPLYCNAGSWTGLGPISFSYQWELSNGAPIEDATTSTFVAPSELAGASMRCLVTAADSVETAAAATPAVLIGAYPGSGTARQSLVAAISVGRLLAHGSRMSVPVFTSLAASATLRAIPQPPARASHARGRPGRTHARPRGLRAGVTIVARRSLRAGRDAIVLTRLRPGVVYLLRLRVESADGQSATSGAVLRVARS